MKFARISQALGELPALVARQLDVELIQLQSADLLAARHLWLLVEVVPAQHLHPVPLIGAVAADQGNFFLWNVVDIRLGGKGVAEGVEIEPFRKAQAL